MAGSREPDLHRIRARGIELACFEWNAHLRGRRPPLFFTHATGFHARVWDRTLAHLGEEWAFCLDQRGHGRSENTPITHWRVFGDDLSALIEALDLREIVGVGHSMGGHAMVDAAARAPGRFARLLLIDPVIGAPETYGEGSFIAELLAAEKHPTAKRRNRFASADEMFERFRDRRPYSLFEPAVLRDYCDYGVLPCGGRDGFELACPPDIEASIYMTSRTNGGVHDSARRVAVPVTVLRARLPGADRDVMDFSSSPTWPGLADTFADGLDVHLADHTHFIPMEAPALTARWVRARDARDD